MIMRNTLILDGTWQYWIDEKRSVKAGDGIQLEKKIGDIVTTCEWKPCFVPSTWNLQQKKLFRFFGTVLFKKCFAVQRTSPDDTIELTFGGVNSKCMTWVNGKFAGEHENGYTSFSLDITAHVHPGNSDDNTVVVYVNNEWGHPERLPWTRTVDWFNYGGIHRHVGIIVKPPARIEDFTFMDEIEFASEASTKPGSISFEVSTNMENKSDLSFEGAILVTIRDVKRYVNVLGSKKVMVNVDGKNHAVFLARFNLDPSLVELWHPDAPNLYSVELSLENKNGEVIDAERARWGFRKVETRGTRFFVNNRPFTMLGTNRHEDHPSFGAAIPDTLIFKDLQIMKEANINCFRGSHYPVAKETLDFCDELGLFFIEEIPAYQLDASHMANPAVLATAKRYFEEMHSRDKNHPCIIAWSMSNETQSDTIEGRAFHEALYAHARAIEKGNRFIIHVSQKRAMERCYDLSDFVTINIYDGWYGGDKEGFMNIVNLIHDILLDEDHELGPPKPIVLTEFGAGAIRGYRSWDAAKWSEDFQAALLEHYIKTAMEHDDFIGGTWTWMFCDTRVDLPTRPDGRPRSYNNKGFVDEFRVPKLAFDVVRQRYAEWKKKINP